MLLGPEYSRSTGRRVIITTWPSLPSRRVAGRCNSERSPFVHARRGTYRSEPVDRRRARSPRCLFRVPLTEEYFHCCYTTARGSSDRALKGEMGTHSGSQTPTITGARKTPRVATRKYPRKIIFLSNVHDSVSQFI